MCASGAARAGRSVTFGNSPAAARPPSFPALCSSPLPLPVMRLTSAASGFFVGIVTRLTLAASSSRIPRPCLRFPPPSAVRQVPCSELTLLPSLGSACLGLRPRHACASARDARAPPSQPLSSPPRPSQGTPRAADESFGSGFALPGLAASPPAVGLRPPACMLLRS